MIEKLKRLWRLLERAWDHTTYWLRCHTYARYHILNMSNKDNDWDWGWKEPDSQLLYANMAILVAYIEKSHCYDKEILTGAIDYPMDEHLKPVEDQCPHMLSQQKDDAEAIAIYKWWKYERAADHQLYEAFFDTHCEKYPLKLEFERQEGTDSVYKCMKSSTGEEKAEMALIWEWEEQLYQKDTDMIQRLIAIRPRLWT